MTDFWRVLETPAVMATCAVALCLASLVLFVVYTRLNRDDSDR